MCPMSEICEGSSDYGRIDVGEIEFGFGEEAVEKVERYRS